MKIAWQRAAGDLLNALVSLLWVFFASILKFFVVLRVVLGSVLRILEVNWGSFLKFSFFSSVLVLLIKMSTSLRWDFSNSGSTRIHLERPRCFFSSHFCSAFSNSCWALFGLHNHVFVLKQTDETKHNFQKKYIFPLDMICV